MKIWPQLSKMFWSEFDIMFKVCPIRFRKCFLEAILKIENCIIKDVHTLYFLKQYFTNIGQQRFFIPSLLLQNKVFLTNFSNTTVLSRLHTEYGEDGRRADFWLKLLTFSTKRLHNWSAAQQWSVVMYVHFSDLSDTYFLFDSLSY